MLILLKLIVYKLFLSPITDFVLVILLIHSHSFHIQNSLKVFSHKVMFFIKLWFQGSKSYFQVLRLDFTSGMWVFIHEFLLYIKSKRILYF